MKLLSALIKMTLLYGGVILIAHAAAGELGGWAITVGGACLGVYVGLTSEV